MEDFTRLPSASQQIVALQTYNPNQRSGPDLEHDIKGPADYWHLLFRRKLLVFGMVLIGAVVGALITLRQTPLYRARTSVEIQNGGEVTVRSGIEGNETTSISETAMMSYLQTQVVILESRSFKKRVTAKLTELKPHAFYTMDSLSGWQQVFGIDAANPPERKIQTGFPPLEIEVQTVPNTRIIEIAVDSPDANFSSDFANGMANEFLGYNLEARWDAAKRTTTWLTAQMETFKEALKQSEDRLQAYRIQAGLILNDKQEGSLEHDKLRLLQQELSRAEEARIGVQTSYEMSLTTAVDSLPAIADDPRIGQYQSRLADLRRQLAELRSDFKPDHPSVKRVEAQIAEMSDTVHAENAIVLSKLDNEFKEAQRKEDTLSKAYEDQLRVVSDEASKMVNYSLLKREVDTNRNLYDTLLSKMKEAGISAAASSSDSRVVDVATAPSKPYKPNIYLNTLGGLMGGFVLALGFVVFRERMDQTFKAPGETSAHLQLPELGVIPERRSVGAPARALKSMKLLKGTQTSKTPDGATTALATWENEPAVVSESFRNVMASIRASEKGGEARVILVTSAGSSDGKSTTVANLGMALAEIGQRVLLIDGDLRKPRLHTTFSLPNEHGLSDLLQQPERAESGPDTFFHQTNLPGLTVLTSGPRPESVSKLLYSRATETLLRKLRTQYDVVLIDTPPILAMSDARVLGRLADGTILVVRAGKTPRDLALAARQRLSEDGVLLLGTVLVAWNGQSRGHGAMDQYYSYNYTS